MKISLLQTAPEGSLYANMEKGMAACRKAKEQEADIALFPEMYSCGYDINGDPDEWVKNAITADDDYVKAFSELASELDMAIGITLLEKHDPKPLNTLMLFDRHGRLTLKYSKVHTCDFSAEYFLSSGDDFSVCDLDTKDGIVRVGAMICFDREFPESARILMLKGAEVIIHPNACPLEINRLSALRTRAYENMVAVATCNYPASVPDCNGHSTVFDGIAWNHDEPGVRDMCILEADGSDGVFTADIDLDMLREYRSREVMGNAYRKTYAYAKLLDDTVEEPFIREGRELIYYT